jgi:hypothetical protein
MVKILKIQFGILLIWNGHGSIDIVLIYNLKMVEWVASPNHSLPLHQHALEATPATETK